MTAALRRDWLYGGSTTEIRRGATLGQIQFGAELRVQAANERLVTTEMSIVSSPWCTPVAHPEVQYMCMSFADCINRSI